MLPFCLLSTEDTGLMIQAHGRLLGIRLFFLLLCVLGGWLLSLGGSVESQWIYLPAAFCFGLLVILVDKSLHTFSIRSFSHGTVGMMIGFFGAWLMTRVLEETAPASDASQAIRMGCYLGLGFLGTMMALRSKRNEFSLLIPYVKFRKESTEDLPHIIDADVIADGRILAMAKTGFLQGELIVPSFVRDEVHSWVAAESEVSQERGRRALDTLDGLQKSTSVSVTFQEPISDGFSESEKGMIDFAEQIDCRILCVAKDRYPSARLQEVQLLSLNDLEEAIRPILQVGDLIKLELVKAGKDPHQAVGYLADGSMVVVNQAEAKIGSHQLVTIASVVPTSAGRLVFAELAENGDS